MNSVQETLGIDVGGVIIDGAANDGADTSFFSKNYLATTAVPDALPAIRRLVTERFEGRVCIVSKCGPNVEEKTRRWFEAHGFFAYTGIRPDQVRFCRTRQEKAPIAAELGITHFVDDKLEVLSYLVTVPTKILFRPKPKEVMRYSRHLPEVTWVETWEEVVRLLIPA